MAVSAAAAVVAGKTVFDYNRENFMLDREMRLKKEFAERRYRIVQAQLWREDVRCFVELTERKMYIYLLVNVLMLGFNFNLWCEGRLPEGTPEWMMIGNQLAIACSFTFLLLTVWLAMHAAVAAQSLQTRVLTQLIRLPIPSWDELEACRTYASEFEKVEPRQMFRIPFITGWQEDLFKGSNLAGQVGDAESGEAVDFTVQTGQSMATDPWGLERRGDTTYELGCHMGDEVAKLRHIKLMRQAAVYWQTYDAFARVSMSVGTNQLMLAISYYILGYEINQLHAPVPAFAGIIILVCTQEVIAQIDLTINPCTQRVFQFLVLFGPTVSFMAAYHSIIHKDMARWVSECLAPFAFISHGVVVGLLTLLLRVTEQENGAMLPLAFRKVLYLDVFGWVYHKDAGPREGIDSSKEAPKSLTLPVSVVVAETAQPAGVQTQKFEDNNQRIGYYAADYVDSYASDAEKAERSDDDDEDVRELGDTAASRHRQTRPALASISYDAHGQPNPTRPEDQMPPGAVHDLRYVSGAPRMWDTVNAIEPPAKGFWDPVSFMPSEGRKRLKMDELLADGAEDCDGIRGGKAGLSKFLLDMPIETGHDNEAPGLVPWKTFQFAAIITSLAWICAGVYCILQVAGIWSIALPQWLFEPTGQPVLPPPSLMSIWESSFTGSFVGDAPERVVAAWPYPSIVPRGFACDSAGQHFLVIDGLSAFTAEIQGKDHHSRHRGISGITANFDRAPHCEAHVGEALQDAAVICSSTNRTSRAACGALLLARNGRQLAHCPLTEAQGKHEDSSTSVSGKWLHQTSHATLSVDAEEISWVFVDSACGANGNVTSPRWDGCASFGTTQGRMAQLRRRSSGKQMVPTAVPSADDVIVEGASESASMRAFDNRYIGLLQPERQSIHLLDMQRGGAFSGSLLLPTNNRIEGFCVGGGYVYMLGDGPSPQMWRFPVPTAFRSRNSTDM